MSRRSDFVSGVPSKSALTGSCGVRAIVLSYGMTYEDILARRDDETIWFRGAELASFCDLLESHGQKADWSTIRAAEHIMGQDESRRSWLDETIRMWVGQALGRDWYIPV